MTEIDSAAFEAGVAPCNFTAGRIDSADESDAAHFSDALGRIYITAQALLLSARPQAGHTQPALTLVVEDSADGSSWATVATFDFTASDQQAAAVDSPRAYLRASWAGVVGTWAVDVAVKSIATPASGGGSQPLTVVGPFPVTYLDLTAFNNESAFVVTNFAAGSIVLDVWAEPVTKWDNADMRFQLGLYNGDLYVNSLDLYNSAPQLTNDIDLDFPADHVPNTSNSWDVVANQAFNAGDGLWLPARIRAGGCNLVATVYDKTGTPTQGQFDVYALVYQPA